MPGAIFPGAALFRDDAAGAFAADEVAFVASGTEAVHRGLLGLTEATGRAGIVHSAVEHSAVLHAAAWHDSPAHVVVPVDSVGRVEVDALQAAAERPGVGAVALQAANQEVGTRQPVDDLDLPPGVPLLVDAAAAAGRIPLPTQWQVLTASARKWGGPAGVGVLVVRRGTRWTSPFPGEGGLDGRTTTGAGSPRPISAPTSHTTPISATLSFLDRLCHPLS